MLVFFRGNKNFLIALLPLSVCDSDGSLFCQWVDRILKDSVKNVGFEMSWYRVLLLWDTVVYQLLWQSNAHMHTWCTRALTSVINIQTDCIRTHHVPTEPTSRRNEPKDIHKVLKQVLVWAVQRTCFTGSGEMGHYKSRDTFPSIYVFCLCFVMYSTGLWKGVLL